MYSSENNTCVCVAAFWYGSCTPRSCICTTTNYHHQSARDLNTNYAFALRCELVILEAKRHAQHSSAAATTTMLRVKFLLDKQEKYANRQVSFKSRLFPQQNEKTFPHRADSFSFSKYRFRFFSFLCLRTRVIINFFCVSLQFHFLLYIVVALSNQAESFFNIPLTYTRRL